MIIIEIDENQHKYYDTTCEILRLNELYEDFGCRPIIFIKFNPDEYIKDGIKNASCFRTHKKTGAMMLKIWMYEEWDKRLKTLKKCIENEIKRVSEDNKFIELFYDDNNLKE